MSGPPMRSAAIVGLGLVGGSIARDLSDRGWRVVADDIDTAAVDDARAAGIVHDHIGAGRVDVDVVVFAVPVTAFAETLLAYSPRLHAPLVIDTGSTKRSAIEAAERTGIASRFVGTHPMAGDHRSGWQASRPGMFRGAHTYLCRTSVTSDAALDLARAFWVALGARVQETSAAEHDHLVAYTSHLPQLLSKALALTLARAAVLRDQLGPGGRDVTRLAAGDATLWTGIARDNREEVVAALRDCEEQLRDLREALDRGEPEALRDLLYQAQQWSA